MIVGARLMLAATALLALSAGSIAAQGTTGRVVGRVSETSSQGPLANVTVNIIGTTLGALTRPDGGFTLLAVQPGVYKLRAARIGYAQKEVSVTVVAGETATVDVNLDANATQLASVVTVGYGTVEAKDRTGVAETITEKQFNTGRVISPEQLIQAKVAGVQVVDNNEPGGGINLRIRGGSSITSSNEPLFVVDGVPLQVGGGVASGRNPLNFLNPNDIESISVLKDASATAIYGSRGSNGVVIITTKSGSQGTQVTYATSFSNAVVVREPDLLNASQFLAAVQQYAPTNVSKIGTSSTNWRDAIQRNAGGQEHEVAVSGGKDAMRYRLSLNYLDQDGVILGTNAKRLAVSLNYSDRVFGDRFELKTSIKGSHTQDAFTPSGVLGAATAFAPTQPIFTSTGSYFQWSDQLGANNPLSDLALVKDHGDTYRSLGNLELKYHVPQVEGLSATVRTGYDYGQGQRTVFSPSTAQTDVETSRGGRFDRSSPRAVNTLLETFGNYSRNFTTSDIDLTAGYTYEESQADSASFYAQQLTTNALGSNGIPGATTSQNFLTDQNSKLISGFGRLNYTVNGRYLFTASVRRDGSSRFGPGKQWGVFPSAAAAWRIIDEPALKDKLPFSDLKLRYSWGKNGNQSFANYLYVSTYQTGGNQAQVQFGNTFVNTIRPSAVDPDIKWEETTSNNFGIDYGFANNRVTGTLDYYSKKTSDLIFNVPVAAGTNLSNYVTTNIGSLQNKGFEAAISAHLVGAERGDGFNWDANFNAATNSNKLLKINATSTGGEAILTGGIAGGVGVNIEVLKPGYPVNSFFVYRHKTGADGKPVTGSHTDLEMYQDINGDGAINQSDRVPYKSPAPKWILGHTSNMSFKRFDASFTVRSYLGAYTYNNVASNFGSYAALSGNSPSNLSASVLKYGFTSPQYFSDLYVEDASFLRLDNITVGYTFRRATRSFASLRLYGTVQNVFTKSKYSGVDPLAGVNGIDNNIYPLSRTFTTGLSVTF